MPCPVFVLNGQIAPDLHLNSPVSRFLHLLVPAAESALLSIPLFHHPFIPLTFPPHHADPKTPAVEDGDVCPGDPGPRSAF